MKLIRRSELMLDSSREPVSATNGGEPVLLLHTGELRDRQRHLWFGPRSVSIYSQETDLQCTTFQRPASAFTDKAGESWRCNLWIMALPTGEVWLGPSACWVAKLREQVVGLLLSKDKRQLLVFCRPWARLSLDRRPSLVFMRLLDEIEADLAAGRFTEDMRVDLPALSETVREADGGERIQDLRVSTIKNLAFAGLDLIVTFGTDNPRTDIALRFGSDWQVAAAQTKDATSAGRYLWNWLRFAE